MSAAVANAENAIEFDRIDSAHALTETVEQDPYRRFRFHYEQVMRLGYGKENAACLATVGKNGAPSARIILVKKVSQDGFYFFSHYRSRKGAEIEQNPCVALVFLWSAIGVQVRIEGKAGPIEHAASKTYFQSRPRQSQVGAWASPQSQVIADRATLLNAVSEVQQRFEGQAVLPLPDAWGGYRIEADAFEFWYSGDARLHDRFAYQRAVTTGATQIWQMQRLAP